MKTLFIISMILALTGCGAVDRGLANLTGSASETCYEGVLYLQFTSGASVAYDINGNVKQCG